MDLKAKNENIKELKHKLRQSPARQSILEIDTLLIDVSDRRAFILLLDMYETEKEITRELLEGLIDHSFDINHGIIDRIEHINNSNMVKQLLEFFSIENIKSIILLALAIGLALSIAFNNNVAPKVVDSLMSNSKDSKDK